MHVCMHVETGVGDDRDFEGVVGVVGGVAAGGGGDNSVTIRVFLCLCVCVLYCFFCRVGR